VRDAYFEFVAAFREATEKLRAGILRLKLPTRLAVRRRLTPADSHLTLQRAEASPTIIP